ncbi:TPA: hypothetical protein ACUISS_005571 [Klebsiella pneumoniae]|uniref:hypothetical protein n=1 Tax=Bacteria TaxID=2 RepID=UPI0002A2AFEC|nr:MULTISPECIES: hypothetical protein [Enterobacteriaceae]EAR7675623.1 hypothetical protein [Salmonella enterica]EAT4972995.1 hypothetical protein [Salmonella enterica subsp. enterica serovar Barranquilla]EBB7595620.1 hypothetical protein [Salmonella enterica subsp. enterica serovar Schwarzengrund]EBH9524368.1 hypothetical protein [Salmonella enterica subsp. enterica serovar Cerro]EBM7746244.1 hypothetical protein [Salmonella enterica subsp. enterica serovar Kentucky]EBM9073477.1 hypothetical
MPQALSPNAGPLLLPKHLCYIEHDGAGRDGEPSQAYGAQTDKVDLKVFKERTADNRHNFCFNFSLKDNTNPDGLPTSGLFQFPG